MKKTASKAASLNLKDLDLAVGEALQRVAQSRELHEAELAEVAGGLARPPIGWQTEIDPPMFGMWIDPSDPWTEIM